MNFLVILSAVCIALASGNGSYGQYQRGNNPNQYGGVSSSHQRELVDVPYTVKYRNLGGGDESARQLGSYGGNSYGTESHQQQQAQPQHEISRAELIYQNSYSQPQRSHSQQQIYNEVPSYQSPQIHSAPPQRNYIQQHPQQQLQQVQQQRRYPIPQQQQQQQSVRQPHQLVDVPYTVEVRNSGRGHSVSPQRPQSYLSGQIQNAPLIQQQHRSYSPSVQQQPQHQQSFSPSRQSKQYVDVPYTLQTRGGNSNADSSNYRFLPFSAGNSLQVQQASQQRSPAAGQLVDVPYQIINGGSSSSSAGSSGNYRFLPYSLGNSLPIGSIGGSASNGGSLGYPSSSAGLSSIIY